jgi:hypothetical protein
MCIITSQFTREIWLLTHNKPTIDWKKSTQCSMWWVRRFDTKILVARQHHSNILMSAYDSISRAYDDWRTWIISPVFLLRFVIELFIYTTLVCPLIKLTSRRTTLRCVVHLTNMVQKTECIERKGQEDDTHLRGATSAKRGQSVVRHNKRAKGTQYHTVSLTLWCQNSGCTTASFEHMMTGARESYHLYFCCVL